MSATPIPWTINGIETTGLAGEQPGVQPGLSAEYVFGFPGGDRGRQAYNDVLEYTRHAGQFDTYEHIESGKWFWREQVADGTSPLVHIVPGSQSPTGREIWGLIESYEDSTTYSESRLQLSLSIFIIAFGDEFDSEPELRTAREEKGP